jgi:hypothetical protein
VVEILAVVGYDYEQAKEILKQNNCIRVTVINMATNAVTGTWDLDPNQDAYTIMEKLIKIYNPVGKYYNLYRDPQGTRPIFYEELSCQLKTLTLGLGNKVWYRIDDDMKSQY